MWQELGQGPEQDYDGGPSRCLGGPAHSFLERNREGTVPRPFSSQQKGAIIKHRHGGIKTLFSLFVVTWLVKTLLKNRVIRSIS